MFSELGALLQQLTDLTIVRVMSPVIAVISLLVNIWLARRTHTAIRIHENLIEAEHERHLESLWHRVNRLTVSDTSFAQVVGEMFGTDAETERREAVLLLFVNVLATAHSLRSRNAIREEMYLAHMQSFFGQYKGDRERLLDTVRRNYPLDRKFIDECAKYLGLPPPAIQV